MNTRVLPNVFVRRCVTTRIFAGLIAAICCLAPGLVADAQELIINGDFETGSFAGWSVVDLPASSGTFYIAAPGAVTPISGFATQGNPVANGAFYAVSDQGGPGTHALLQTFTVSADSDSVILSFDMFVNDWSASGGIIDPIGLDHTGPPNQHARVDILTAAAAPFDTGAGVLGSYYLGVDAGTLPRPFTSYQFDITSVVGSGGTFQLRFAEVDNQAFHHQGVDNVSIMATDDVPTLGAWAMGLLVSLLVSAGVMVLRYTRLG